MNLVELLEKSVTKITEELDELSVEQLNELRALELIPEGKNRSSLVALIDGKLAELNASPAAAAPSVAEAVVDWQQADYSGPLTGQQAMWRVANVPRFAREAVTK